MLFNKKGISSYILVFLFFSIIMTFILFFLLGTIYEEDNILCQEVKYELNNLCKKSGYFNFDGKNLGTRDFDFVLSSKQDSLNLGETKSFKIFTEEKSLEFLPIVNDGINNHECSSKSQKIKMEIIPLC